jgi:hypothetical protein
MMSDLSNDENGHENEWTMVEGGSKMKNNIMTIEKSLSI